MPSITVPLTRSPPSSETLRVAYSTRGTGPVLVLLISGLCVPSSMYDDMSAVLAATAQFTAVAMDNRGIGDSSVVPASLFSSPGYTVSELAADGWAVIDRVFADRDRDRNDDGDNAPPSPVSPLRPHVALVGHSMGGMIAQAMLTQRPHRVRFIALLSTHAGGLWNLLPTLSIIRSAARVAWSGFDRDVHASVNLSLHFTQRFLDDWIGTDVYPAPFNPPQLTSDRLCLTPPRCTPTPSPVLSPTRGAASSASSSSPMLRPSAHTEHALLPPQQQQQQQQPSTLRQRRGSGGATIAGQPVPSSSRPTATGNSDTAQSHGSLQPSAPSQPSSPPPRRANASDSPITLSSPSRPHVGGPTINFFESKVLEFARDAHIYFGLSLATLPEALRHPRHIVLDALARQRQRRARPRRSRRFDIYHARYTGLDERGRGATHPSASAPALLAGRGGEVEGEGEEGERKSVNEREGSASEEDTTRPPDPAATHVLYGHVGVVRSHSLSRRFARKVRACSALFKLVVTGRHDRVVTPSATRALAAAVAANTVVEVDAAHFVTDEAAAEVTTHVVYGLRKAFFAPRSRACECEWCAARGATDWKGGEDGGDGGFESCRMC